MKQISITPTEAGWVLQSNAIDNAPFSKGGMRRSLPPFGSPSACQMPTKT